MPSSSDLCFQNIWDAGARQAAGAHREPDRRYRRTEKSVLEVGRTHRCHGDRAAADNWAWDFVATKQRSLSNEINDVVLGRVSLRRGLYPNSPPKVKKRTITHRKIHQAFSLKSRLGQQKMIKTLKKMIMYFRPQC